MAAAEELGEEITQAELRQMISQCDPDGEGFINLQNFVKFNKKKNFD